MFEHLDDPRPFEPDDVFRGRVMRRVRTRRMRRRVAQGTVSAVTVVALVAGTFAVYEWRRIDGVPRVKVDTTGSPPAGEPFNILVVGSDRRDAVDGPANPPVAPRSDTIMLVRVDRAAGTLTVLSLPRDLLVSLPDGTQGRINQADTGGPNALVQTVFRNFGIAVTHYVDVDFQGLVDLVDLAGGLKLDFTAPARDDMTGLSVATPGCQTLHGTTALAYVRSRHFEWLDGGAWHDDPRGDLGRIARQQVALQALFGSVRAAYASPAALDRFVDELRSHVTLDDQFPTAELVSLARFVASLPDDHVERAQLPVAPAIIDNVQVLTTAQGADAVLARFGGREPAVATSATGVTPPYAPQAPPEATPALCD